MTKNVIIYARKWNLGTSPDGAITESFQKEGDANTSSFFHQQSLVIEKTKIFIARALTLSWLSRRPYHRRPRGNAVCCIQFSNKNDGLPAHITAQLTHRAESTMQTTSAYNTKNYKKTLGLAWSLLSLLLKTSSRLRIFFMIILQVEACHKHSTKSPISAEEVLDKTSVESLGNTFSIYILFLFLTETVGETWS